ncbi:MAG: dethiobiotin synthase [Candidatus Nitrosoglobus sp.]|jgi:dethiobiotin synthetase
MGKGIFVTGTDTEIGKTCCSLGLMICLQRAGYQVAAMKPVASGCKQTKLGMCNEDAMLLSRYANVSVTYQQVNPYALTLPIAPHVAAAVQGVEIQPAVIKASFDAVSTLADAVVVEGIGGWAVPINAKQTMADVAILLDLPVVLVVGLRLGCLNHALLTTSAIMQAGLPLAGWIANNIKPTSAWAKENIQALCERLPMPLLGTVPYLSQPTPEMIATFLDIRLCMIAAKIRCKHAIVSPKQQR